MPTLRKLGGPLSASELKQGVLKNLYCRKIALKHVSSSLFPRKYLKASRQAIYWTGLAHLMLYNYLKNILIVNRRWQWRPPPSFNNLNELWCWSMLRFRKRRLARRYYSRKSYN
jgi:hypothetical protein